MGFGHRIALYFFSKSVFGRGGEVWDSSSDRPQTANSCTSNVACILKSIQLTVPVARDPFQPVCFSRDRFGVVLYILRQGEPCVCLSRVFSRRLTPDFTFYMFLVEASIASAVIYAFTTFGLCFFPGVFLSSSDWSPSCDHGLDYAS